MKQNRWLAGLMAVMLCLFSGCASLGGDIASQLRPPKAMGEQGAAEEALSAYITANDKRVNYTLKYPRSGEYRSAFLLKDLDSDGISEAVAFYDTESDRSHINLLRQNGDEWSSVYDLSVLFADIHYVTLGDMNGDGISELIVCWDMFSDRTYQLAVYDLAANRITERFTATTSSVTVVDLTGDGHDDCLLWHADSQTLAASLWSMSAEAVEEVGRCTVDDYVQGVKMPQVVTFSDGRKGVFMDCEKSGDVRVTQLVYWENGQLLAPFYSETDGGNRQTVRPVTIPAADVDGDGSLEWPRCYPLVGHEEETESHTRTATCLLTEFWNWDAARGEAVKKFSCVYNDNDKYYLLTEEDFGARFTTDYSAEDRTLWVRALGDAEHKGSLVFAVRAVPNGQTPPDDDGVFAFSRLLKSNYATYYVWYDKANAYAINEEALQYMLTAF